MTDEVTKEQVYATLGKYLAGELKKHTGHIDGFYPQPWGKDDKLMEIPMNNYKQSGLIIPYKELTPEALQGVIQEFVTRDGTDYGEREMPLETKVQQVMSQLHAGEVVIVFDQKAETCNIVSKDAIDPDIIK